MSSCKWLRDISELPPNISVIWMVDCVSLEVFLTLSNILEQKDAPVIKWMDLSNCHRLVDNLGIDVVSKMAKALLNQVFFLTMFSTSIIIYSYTHIVLLH